MHVALFAYCAVCWHGIYVCLCMLLPCMPSCDSEQALIHTKTCHLRRARSKPHVLASARCAGVKRTWYSVFSVITLIN